MGAAVYTYKKLGRAVEVVLPNKSITSLHLPGAVSFDIGDEHLLGPHGKLGAMVQTKRRKSVSAAQYARMYPEETAEDDPEVVYGPPRYHFEPYAGALPSGPLQEAHEHIRKLQRWNKAQDRTIEKLKDKCKALSRTVKKQAKSSAKFMKKVAEVLTRGGIAGCSSADFEFPDTSVPQPRPHPTALGFPLTAKQQERRNRNPPIPPSASGNKSPSLASSDDEIHIDEVQSQPRYADYPSAPGGYYTTFPPDDEWEEAPASTRFP